MRNEESLILQKLEKIETLLEAQNINNDNACNEVDQIYLEISKKDKAVTAFRDGIARLTYYMVTDKIFNEVTLNYINLNFGGPTSKSSENVFMSRGYIAVGVLKFAAIFFAPQIADYTVIPFRKAAYDRSIDPILEEIVYPLVNLPLNYVAYPVINIASDYIVNPIYDSMPTPIKETACDLRNKTYDNVIEPIGEFWSDLEITI